MTSLPIFYGNANLIDGKIENVKIIKGDRNYLTIWADEGKRNIINSVKGVNSCLDFKCKYSVDIDPRYDIEVVIQNLYSVLEEK